MLPFSSTLVRAILRESILEESLTFQRTSTWDDLSVVLEEVAKKTFGDYNPASQKSKLQSISKVLFNIKQTK